MKQVLLQVVEEYSKQGAGYLQSEPILQEVAKRLSIRQNTDLEQALLTLWHDMFRQGQLSMGYNLDNPDLPFCHITALGRQILSNISRDPANPDGYLAHLSSLSLNSIAESYISEALLTYNTGCFKATAVMVGCAAESMSLEIRDKIVGMLQNSSRPVPGKLNDWRIRTVLQAVQSEIDQQKSNMPKQLRESYEAYWPAFTQQIRAIRNDAGHPSSTDTVTPDSVHASLLIFPELAALSYELTNWITSSFI